MKLKFTLDNVLFLALLMLFGSSPIAYLLGGVFKWIGLVGGFLLIVYVAFNKAIRSRRLGACIPFIAVSTFYFFLLEGLGFLNNHYSTRSVQGIVFSVVVFALFISGYLIAQSKSTLSSMKTSILEVVFSVLFIVSSIKYIEYVALLNFQVQGRLLDGGDAGNPVGIAYQFSILLIIFLYLSVKQSNILHRLVFLIAAITALLVIMTTESRGAIVALSLGSGLVFFAGISNGSLMSILRAKKNTIKNIIVFVLGGLVSFVGYSLYSANYVLLEKYMAVYKRFQSLSLMLSGSGGDRSAQNRLDIYASFLNRMSDWIILGDRNLSGYPHNQFLEIMCRWGLLGIPLLIASIYAFSRLVLIIFSKKFKTSELWFMSLLFAFSYTQSQTSLSLDMNRALFLSMGFFLGYKSILSSNLLRKYAFR